jgi:acetyltransferase-like isoleucine patch superfamily enzyme
MIPGDIGVSLRRLFWTPYFGQCGSNLYMGAWAIIHQPGQISIGNDVVIQNNTWIGGIGGVRIGNYVLLGPYTFITTANHKYSDPNLPVRFQGHEYKEVIIEDDVWVGAHVKILPGTHIGRGAIIVAGSVVSGKVQPMSVMAGFPARKIGMREMVPNVIPNVD